MNRCLACGRLHFEAGHYCDACAEKRPVVASNDPYREWSDNRREWEADCRDVARLYREQAEYSEGSSEI